jgi:uncharacterized membrane protein
MSIVLIKDITDDIIPFPPSMYELSVFHSFLCFFGFIFTAIVIAAIIKSRQKKAQHYLILSLCIADLLFSSTAGRKIPRHVDVDVSL